MIETKIPWETFPKPNQKIYECIDNNPHSNINPNSFLGLFEGKNKESGSNSNSSSSSNSNQSEGPGVGASILTGLTSVLGVLGAMAPILPAIGIGSGSRIAESNAIANGNAQVYNAQNQLLLTQKNADKGNEKIYIIGGVGVFLMVIVIFALRSHG